VYGDDNQNEKSVINGSERERDRGFSHIKRVKLIPRLSQKVSTQGAEDASVQHYTVGDKLTAKSSGRGEYCKITNFYALL
jgi:hypothetical protein